MNSRQMHILDTLSKQSEVNVQELVERFGVSSMTIRRDLAMLEEKAQLTRTHGGAVLSRSGIVEFAFVEKGKARSEEKKAIACEVARLIEPGMSICLDTGTTTLEIARRIAGVKNLTVLTCSLPIASVLYACDNIELVLLGGNVRKGYPDITGPLTEESVGQYRVNLTVHGADGVNEQGVFANDARVARVSQRMISIAERVVLAVDYTKFETSGFTLCSGWDGFNHVITDEGVPSRTRLWLEQKVGKVTYCNTNQQGDDGNHDE
jgi:DeoR/GlpR family transcriptional regulator of sugar metabolism